MKYMTTCKQKFTRTLDSSVGSKGQNDYFSENDHVAYQIKENDTYNNMQAIKTTTPPSAK